MLQAALELEPMPLNQQDWNFRTMVEDTHEGMLFRNMKLLRDTKQGSEQWQEIMNWMDAPFDGTYPPFAFATCCKVCGIEDPEEFRDQILSQLGLI